MDQLRKLYLRWRFRRDCRMHGHALPLHPMVRMNPMYNCLAIQHVCGHCGTVVYEELYL